MTTVMQGKRKAPQPLQKFNTFEIITSLFGVILLCLLIAAHQRGQYQYLVDTNNIYGMRIFISSFGIPIALMAGGMYHWSKKNKLPSPFLVFTILGCAWFAFWLAYAVFS